ncbi:MAG: hypothetical protein FWG29_09730 [Treponema sp.]|nr:hypothetical protein [Treponema sp.]
MARMKASHRTPWAYKAGTTALHRCPAGIKLILLLLLSAAPFFGFPFAGGAAALIFIGAIFADVKPGELLSGSLPLLTLLVLFALFRSLNIDSGIRIDSVVLQNGLYTAASILICFAAASLFFAVTTITEIRKTIAGAELLVFRRQGRLSLALALMLGFLPRFFECWENAKLAVSARCCKNRFKQVMVILPLVTERMIETAAETAEALTSRGYE